MCDNMNCGYVCFQMFLPFLDKKGGGYYDKKRAFSLYYNIIVICPSILHTIQIIKASDINYC